MDFIINNWYFIFLALAVILVVVRAIRVFLNRPTDAQIKTIKEWLLWACTEAEKELGGGTGKLKLRYVYDAFLSKFPGLSAIISFDMLSGLVDEVLEDMREILSSNKQANAYVYEAAPGVDVNKLGEAVTQEVLTRLGNTGEEG